MPLNCGAGEDSWESLGLQGDPTSPSWRKSTLKIHWKDWCWSWRSNTLKPYVKNQLIRKDPDAGKGWRQEEKGMTENETAGWHHWPNGHEFEQTLGNAEGQGGLECCSPWGHKESDTTERLNNNSNDKSISIFFWKTSILFSLVAAPTYIPTSRVRGLRWGISTQQQSWGPGPAMSFAHDWLFCCLVTFDTETFCPNLRNKSS